MHLAKIPNRIPLQSHRLGNQSPPRENQVSFKPASPLEVLCSKPLLHCILHVLIFGSLIRFFNWIKAQGLQPAGISLNIFWKFSGSYWISEAVPRFERTQDSLENWSSLGIFYWGPQILFSKQNEICALPNCAMYFFRSSSAHHDLCVESSSILGIAWVTLKELWLTWK